MLDFPLVVNRPDVALRAQIKCAQDATDKSGKVWYIGSIERRGERSAKRIHRPLAVG